MGFSERKKEAKKKKKKREKKEKKTEAMSVYHHFLNKSEQKSRFEPHN